jgi:hypothetical protein
MSHATIKSAASFRARKPSLERSKRETRSRYCQWQQAEVKDRFLDGGNEGAQQHMLILHLEEPLAWIRRRTRTGDATGVSIIDEAEHEGREQC